jgi:hypothetical protein
MLLVATLVACAGSSGRVTSSHTGGGILPRPPVLIVYEFGVDAQDVVVDTFGSADYARAAPADADRYRRGREASRSLADKLVAQLRERGIRAERATLGTVPPLHAVMVKGHFVVIDEGNRAARMVVGFGAGAREVRVRVQVYQRTGHGLRPLQSGVAEATGDRMPGMAVPVGVGAAAGRAATSAVVSGGLNVASEATGALDADLDRLATRIADEGLAFYKLQQWM